MGSVNTNYYELLGVSRDATADEIKKAYRKQAMKYHPDRNPGDKEAEAMMKKINDAREILSDPEKRKRYDYELEHEERQKSSGSNRGYSWTGGYSSGYSSYNQGNWYYRTYQNDDSRGSQQNNSQYESDWYERFWSTHTTKDNKDRTSETVEELFKEYLNKLKESYNNARTFEKKIPFKKRHDFVKDELFAGDGLFDNCAEVEDYLRKIFSKDAVLYFSIHSLVELLLIGYKLKKLKTDDFPTYIMRNRRTFAGILVAMYLLFGINGTDKVEQPKESTSITQEDTNEEPDISLSDGYALYRIYEVEAGDSLSKLSSDSNTTINYIMEINNLSSTDIKIGQKLIIPYIIDKDELKYYTKSVEIGTETTYLDDIAKEYNTDLRTLYSINAEAFYFDGEKYIIMSDTILVPTFPTQNEVNDLKANDSYRKVS